MSGLLRGHIRVPLEGKSDPDTAVKTYRGGLRVRFVDALSDHILEITVIKDDLIKF